MDGGGVPPATCPDLGMGEVVPTVNQGGGTYLGWREEGTYPGSRGGVPTLEGGGYLPWGTASHLGVDRQTPVKTVPSRRTMYTGSKNANIVKSGCSWKLRAIMGN